MEDEITVELPPETRLAVQDEKLKQALAALEVMEEMTALLPKDEDGGDPQLLRAVMMAAFLTQREASLQTGVNINTLGLWIKEHRNVFNDLVAFKRMILSQQAQAISYMGLESLKTLIGSLPRTSLEWRAEIPRGLDRAKMTGYIAQTLKMLTDMFPDRVVNSDGTKHGVNWGKLNKELKNLRPAVSDMDKVKAVIAADTKGRVK